MDGWTMNWKGLGRRRSLSDRETASGFAYIRTAERMESLIQSKSGPTEIRTIRLPNTSP